MFKGVMCHIFKPGIKLIQWGLSLCVFMCVCMCVSAPMLLITSGMIWHDMNHIRLVNKFYSCYYANVVDIINGHGLNIDMHHRH